MVPRDGKLVAGAQASRDLRVSYATAIGAALQGELGNTHRAVKTIMRWTGATERTVRNWLTGANGPAGEHLVSLARKSDAVFAVFAELSDRQPSVPIQTVIEARDALERLLSGGSGKLSP
jgi:hypothetical protein